MTIQEAFVDSVDQDQTTHTCSLISDLLCKHFYPVIIVSSSFNASIFLANEKLRSVYSVVKELILFFEISYWRGHQISLTVESLKGRLPQKLQSKSTLSCEIVQIHSLLRHGFIKKRKSKFNRNRK